MSIGKKARVLHVRACVCAVEQSNTRLFIQPNSLVVNAGHDQICKRGVGLVEGRLQPRAWGSTCYNRRVGGKCKGFGLTTDVSTGTILDKLLMKSFKQN